MTSKENALRLEGIDDPALAVCAGSSTCMGQADELHGAADSHSFLGELGLLGQIK